MKNPLVMAPRAWTMEDQLEFANISGDFNPIHIDPLEARRSIFGKTVVHGIHLVLWALDEYCSLSGKKIKLKKLKAVFRKPVGVNEQVALSMNIDKDLIGNLSIDSDGMPRAFMTLELAQEDFRPEMTKNFQKTFTAQVPRDLPIEELINAQGTLEMGGDINVLQSIFPALCKCMPVEQIALLLTTTRLVGMECPGRYSIYNELHLNFNDSHGPIGPLNYKIEDFNEPFKLFQIQLTSSVAEGYLKAFVRPSIKGPYKIDDIKKHVTTGEFKGQKALVIGGSRGLGAIAAKILALGGAEVFITFNNGHKEAMEINEELKAHGCSLKAVKFDVLDRDKKIKDALDPDWHPTHLYYFATPFIFEGAKKRFSENLFDHFCQFYAVGFWRLFSQLVSPQDLKYILYPSSSALDEMPGGMFEYAAAKAAGESICDYIRKNYPGTIVACPRLERLATDQTVSIIPVENKDPLPVLMGLLRKNGTQ